MTAIPNQSAERSDSLLAYRESGAVVAFPRLRLVHLSDLHFVTHSILKLFQPKGLRGHNPDSLEALNTIVRELTPDLIFSTGDETTWGDRTSLRAARDFLLKLAQSVGLSDKCVFCIPGNHDVLLHYYGRPLFKRRNYDLVFGELEPIRLLEVMGYKLAIFSFDSTLDRKGEWSPLWPLVGSRGRVSARSFNEFNRVKQEMQDLNERFRISEVHHHPLPIPYKADEAVGLELTTMTNGGTFIAHMQESGVNLVLHGHEHCPYSASYCYDPDAPEVILAAAGTACQNQERNPSFNYLEIVPRSRIVVRQYQYCQAGFKLNRDRTKVFDISN